ncbi:MAG: ABC transporter permease [Eubacteriales bacterium]|nr:ABC transporter permease [Eubacteriales bacterium]
MDVALLIALFLASAVRMAVPLLLGTLGESLTERAGNLNLGVEGLMMMGAATGFIAAYHTDNIALAVLAGMLGSGFGSLLYAILTITFRTKQDVTGLALTIFGSGFANTLGKTLANTNTPEGIRTFAQATPLKLPESTASIPGIGPVLAFIDTAFLQHNWFVYLTFIAAFAGWFYLFRTRQGLHLRMIGENPAAADASGIRVIGAKYAHVVVGGILCGLGGVYISVINVGTYLENIVAGRGWIVVALVIFIRWDPLKAIAGSLLFGALEIVGFRIQHIEALSGLPIFSQYAIDMYPYLMTIIVLILTYARKKAYLGPAGLGVPYFREDR